MIKGFRDFAIKGNLVDIAVGMILGTGVLPIAKSLVDDIVMPPIGLLMGNVDFKNIFLVIREGQNTPPPYLSLDAAKAAGAITMKFGVFVNTMITVVIVAFAAYMIMRGVQRLRDEFKAQEPLLPPEPNTEKECGRCFSKISINLYISFFSFLYNSKRIIVFIILCACIFLSFTSK